MEIETTVAPAGFHLRHSELHHYTSLAGLEGILRSNSLWATHFQSLNDQSEVTHLERDLTAAVADATVPLLNRLRLIDRRLDAEIRGRGGPRALAKLHAYALVNSFYRVAFTGQGAEAMAVPYIASFCSHASDQSYERQNGLLSQWRGYGGQGGCCLVFDTQRLIELILKESEEFYWVAIGIDDVTYATSDVVVAKEYSALVGEFVRLLEGGIRRQTSWMPASERGITGFIEATTRFKHQGFREEREVRIVTIPGTIEVADRTAQQNPGFVPLPIKPIKRLREQNRDRPFVSLFDTLDTQLPIKRVIVGPSKEQQANVRKIQAIAGRSIEVVLSATPFVE